MHTIGQTTKFIEKVFGPIYLTNAGKNANVSCPRCRDLGKDPSKRKLAIRTDNFLVHCWSCSYKARSILGLVRQYKPELLSEFIKSFLTSSELLLEVDTTPTFKTPLALPQGYTLLAEHYRSETATLSVRRALDYLARRGITYSDLWYYKLGITDQDPDYRNRIIIPSFDSAGIVNFFTARAITEWIKPKYSNPTFDRRNIIFNELHLDWTRELVLVEGPFDLMKCDQNATCLLGKELGLNSRLFAEIVTHATPIIVACDADAQPQLYRMAQQLHEYDVSVRVLRMPSTYNDIGEMTKEAFEALKQSAEPFDYYDLLRMKITEL